MDKHDTPAHQAFLLKKLQDEMRNPVYAERIKILAQYAKDKFDAYVAAGFTEAQALHLTRGAE